MIFFQNKRGDWATKEVKNVASRFKGESIQPQIQF